MATGWQTEISQRVRELLGTAPDLLMKADAEFQRLRRSRGFRHEDRSYPVTLEPFLLSASDAALIQGAATGMHSVLEYVGDLYRDDVEVRGQISGYDAAGRWLLVEPHVRPYVTVCRFDGVLIDGRYRIMETNTCCPGGVIKVPAQFPLWQHVVKVLLGAVPYEAGDQPYIADTTLFARTILAVHQRQFGTTPAGAAIVNLNGLYTNEVDLIAADLESLGVPARTGDAADFHVKGRTVLLNGLAVDLTYNKLDQLELIADRRCADYLDAGGDGAICFLSSLMAQCILEDKAVLAVMSDPLFADRFTPGQQALIDAHVPWSRVVRPGRTTAEDDSVIDLPDYVARNRVDLVLKRRNLTRGESVLVGPFTDPDIWSAALAEAVRTGGWIVQRRLPLPMTDLVTGVPPRARRMMYEVDTYLFDGEFAGFLCRASIDPVVNVGRVGTMVPVIVESPAEQEERYGTNTR